MPRVRLACIGLALVLLTPSACSAGLAPVESSESSQSPRVPERVVVLHGLARRASSMDSLTDRLRSEGYVVTPIDYDSRGNLIGIEILGPVQIKILARLVDSTDRTAFRRFAKESLPPGLCEAA